MNVKILEANNAKALAELINEYLNEGWELHGNMVNSQCTDHEMTAISHTYAQMVKKVIQ